MNTSHAYPALLVDGLHTRILLHCLSQNTSHIFGIVGGCVTALVVNRSHILHCWRIGHIPCIADGWVTFPALLVDGSHILHCLWIGHILSLLCWRMVLILAYPALLVDDYHILYQLPRWKVHISCIAGGWLSYSVSVAAVEGTHILHCWWISGFHILHCWCMVYISCIAGEWFRIACIAGGWFTYDAYGGWFSKGWD